MEAAEDEMLKSVLTEQFQAVLGSGEAITLPCDYSRRERKIAHKLAKKFGLEHKSHGMGEERCLHVWCKIPS